MAVVAEEALAAVVVTLFLSRQPDAVLSYSGRNSCLSAALLVALAVSGGSFARYGYCC